MLYELAFKTDLFINTNVLLSVLTGRQGGNEKNETAPVLEPVPGLPGALPPPPAYLHPFPPQVNIFL